MQESVECRVELLRHSVIRTVSCLPPPSSLMAPFFTANQERLAAIHKRLAELEAQIDAACAKRDAAKTRLLMLGRTDKPAATTDDGFFSILGKGETI